VRARSPLVAVASAAVIAAVASAAIAAPAPAAGSDPAKTIPPGTVVVPAHVPTTTVAPTVPSMPSVPPTTPAPTTSPTAPTTAATVPAEEPPIGDVIDIGDAKEPRPYDAYLSASVRDLDVWWGAEFPRLFDGEWSPLAGGIFAAYPSRTTPIPGCGGGASSTSYQDVSDYGAFYCPLGDFMAYDDGAHGILAELAARFGDSVLAVVFAHEYGHAVQFRNGALDRDLPTVITEQQADCFSGAWSRRAWDGAAPGVTFTDTDLRSGLIALVFVRDPVGANVFDDGGHGSAFDRIGAFQHGFLGGIDACADLIDQPLPLLPNQFTGSIDAQRQGNARFGYDDGQIMDLVVDDLTTFWPNELAAHETTIPSLQLQPVTDPQADTCGLPVELATAGAAYCPQTGMVLFDEEQARFLYDEFGDFAVGYAIGHAWADAVQAALGLTLNGEPRSLVSDCLVGAWSAGAIRAPDNFSGTTTTSPLHPDRNVRMSPGDLDEAVQSAIVMGDEGFGDNVRGSAFEKIAYLRIGVLNGTDRCLDEAARLADG
jgi:predicted metalloprotease